MSSKFAGEAMAQSLKQELYMTQGDGPTIDISVRRVACCIIIVRFARMLRNIFLLSSF